MRTLKRVEIVGGFGDTVKLFDFKRVFSFKKYLGNLLTALTFGK